MKSKQSGKKADEAKISISLSTLITLLGLVVTIMLAIAGSVAGVYQSFFIPAARSDLEIKLENLKKQYQDQVKLDESALDALRKQLIDAQNARSSLLESTGSPVLLSPKNDEVLITNQITFSWDYKSEQIPHFIIEVARFSKNGLTPATYRVLQPQNRLFHIPITEDGDTGQYLWRVRPGLISEDHQVATGPWSAYQSFWVFTSVKQKIAHMRHMTVGMYPSFTDKFNLPLPGGKYEGLSVELGRLIASELNTKLHPATSGAPDKIQIEFVSFAWQDLLTELSKNSVDMVISSVTATKAREQKYGISFSKGYYVTHQMLLSNQLSYDTFQSLFENIRNKRIGVLKGTTNERAAFYLAKMCHCNISIKADYLELIESKNALFRREVDLLLTDDIWLTGQSNLATFRQYGPALDKVLLGFYESEYGRPQEEYAVAVAKKGGEEILQAINEVLESEKTKQLISAAVARARGRVDQSSALKTNGTP